MWNGEVNILATLRLVSAAIIKVNHGHKTYLNNIDIIEDAKLKRRDGLADLAKYFENKCV